jgi:hypothetical protein
MEHTELYFVFSRFHRSIFSKKNQTIFFEIMSSSSSAQAALVTTQGASVYSRASVNRTKPSAGSSTYRKSVKKIKTDAKLPPDVHSTIANEPGVCYVPFSGMDPIKTAAYELMRGGGGSYKYVQQTADGRFFDVSYYNAEIGKSVFLGRFADECTASFAHALARSDMTCRTVDRAAQGLIERAFVVSVTSNQVQSMATIVPPIPSSAMSNGDPIEDDSLDYDTLFEELVSTDVQSST